MSSESGEVLAYMPQVLLEVEDLRTLFLTEEGVVRAVDGVSFRIHESERLGVVGESGSGKSVTAASIMRLIDPPGAIVGGEVRLRGRDLLQISETEMHRIRGRDIAMIFQDPMTALDPVFSIGDQMVETLKAHQSISRRNARLAAVDALRDVHIPNADRRLEDYPHQFSGGMRQRVVVAMALMCRPALLIADEPTTALDVTTQAQVLELMLSLADELGTAVMLITHDLGVVAGFCDTVQVMYAGRIVEQGSALDIYRTPGHPYTRGLLGSVTRLDDEAAERLSSIRGTPPSLVDPPDGCSFHPRCELAQDVCRNLEPVLSGLGWGHRAACHFAREVMASHESTGR